MAHREQAVYSTLHLPPLDNGICVITYTIQHTEYVCNCKVWADFYLHTVTFLRKHLGLFMQSATMAYVLAPKLKLSVEMIQWWRFIITISVFETSSIVTLSKETHFSFLFYFPSVFCVVFSLSFCVYSLQVMQTKIPTDRIASDFSAPDYYWNR